MQVIKGLGVVAVFMVMVLGFIFASTAWHIAHLDDEEYIRLVGNDLS